MKPEQKRQGDVLLHPVKALPENCVEIQPDGKRVVFAYGEVTGHAHAIYDYIDHEEKENETDVLRNQEMAEAAIARAKFKKVILWKAPNGARYAEVRKTIELKHEEHTVQTFMPGIYIIPIQVQHTPEFIVPVID